MPTDCPVHLSIREVMSFSITSEGMPGYIVKTCTAGVLKIGNRSFGSLLYDMMPINIKNRDIAVIKYGFLMAKYAMIFFGYFNII